MCHHRVRLVPLDHSSQSYPLSELHRRILDLPWPSSRWSVLSPSLHSTPFHFLPCPSNTPTSRLTCSQRTVLLSDYLLVRKASPYNLKQLYTTHGIYWYFHGWNFRALAALICGILPTLPGLVHQVNPNLKVAKGEIDFYYFGWLVGLIISAYA